MADQQMRALLDEKEPNLSFEEFVNEKMKVKGIPRDEVFEYMVGSAARTNKTINTVLGLED
jgi:hypothetical protein